VGETATRRMGEAARPILRQGVDSMSDLQVRISTGKETCV
jgi:hypothetical protein